MSDEIKKLKIGTRGSPLALTQTNMVRDGLLALYPSLEVEIVIITTSGDWKPEDGEVRLQPDAGGKAQFAKEIEEALLSGAVDAAVHSMKDMETTLPEGLQIKHMLPREDARDVIISNELADNIQKITSLPYGAVVGTASVRRQAFLLSKRPDLKIVPLRGNVQTRLEKLRAGQVDVTLLALAGLKRLGLDHEASFALSVDDMLPAAAQGAVGIETRTADKNIVALFDGLGCDDTFLRVSAERSVLHVLGASCHTPIGCYATLEKGRMNLRAQVVALDGAESYGDEIHGEVRSIEDAQALGAALGEALFAVMPDGFLDQQIETGS